MSEYQESIAKAREIVAEIPAGSGDYDKILFLYQWLTEHVRYDFNDYYESEWNLLYDTMIKNQTVCAGYTEALYVMANLAGVECFTQAGNINDGGGWSSHIWNVAKIDGEYYLFDSTWDEGLDPSRYCFFGVSSETMQSYRPRLIIGMLKDYCPPCTKDLPLPGGFSLPAELQTGAVDGSTYSQPYMDLTLSWGDSWTALTRDEINEAFYGGGAPNLRVALKLGIPYVDLVLRRGREMVEVFLEYEGVEASDGSICDSPASYMDAMDSLLSEELEGLGLKDVKAERFQKEIGGQLYEGLTVSGSLGIAKTCQYMLCTMKDNVFLTIMISSESPIKCKQILQSFLGETP